MIIVSACLADIKCRYDGKAKPNKKIIELIKQGKAIPVCPEQLGGLTTPRTSAEIVKNKVITKEGKDITQNYIIGAKETLKIVKLYNCKKAILKNKSPSCGCGLVYDGTFSGKLKKGEGITTKLLKNNNIEVISDEET